MRRPRLAILPALLAIIMLVGSFPHAVAAQPRSPDPYDILEASANAMNNVQAARFTASVDMRMASGGTSMNMQMTMGGEYRAPDRMRMTMDLGNLLGALADPSMTGPMEMIIIGDNAWMRVGSQPWEPMYSGMGMGMSRSSSMSNAADFQRHMREMGRYIPNAVLAETPAGYEIRGDLDLNAAMADLMDMSSMMGMGMPTSSMTPSEMQMLENMTTRFTARINRSTLFMEGMRITMDVSEPRGTGSSGSMVITFDASFSDYNSPTIVIEPPL